MSPGQHNNIVLYIGVTNDIRRRIKERNGGMSKGSFSKRYRLCKLVYYEVTNDIQVAIQREKQLKNWKRVWKLELIEKIYPGFDDLNIN